MEQKPVLDVNEVPKPGKWLFLSIQHLFAMFGSTVLVPFLTGLNPSVALISSGLGTLAFLLITKGQVPAYLGSSFAFIAPIITAKRQGTWSSNAWWFASRTCIHLNLTRN